MQRGDLDPIRHPVNEIMTPILQHPRYHLCIFSSTSFILLSYLELVELLDLLSCPRLNSQNVESHCLAQRSALSDGDDIALFSTERWAHVRGQVGVSLLISGVFGNEVEVLSADDQSSVHLGRDDASGEDTATDRDHTGEWALLVDICSLNSSLWCSETQTDIFVPSSTTLSDLSALCRFRLGIEEDVRLLLVGALRLDGQFGCHDCELAGRGNSWGGCRR